MSQRGGTKHGKKTLLKRVFGRVILTLRQPQRAEEFAARLGLKKRSLQRIEAGRDPLQARYCLHLAWALRDQGLDWARTAHIVAAIHAVEANADDRKFIASVVEELASSDSTLGDALRQALPLGDSESGSAFERAVGAMTGFLTSGGPIVRGLSEERLPPWISRAARQVSPVYFDMLSDQLDRLAAFQPAVREEGLIQWESTNSRNFARVYGIVREPHVLLDAAEAQASVEWGYVWREDFEALLILVMRDSESARSTEDALQNALVARGRQRARRSNDDDRRLLLRDKVRVRSFDTVERQLRQELGTALSNSVRANQPVVGEGQAGVPSLDHPSGTASSWSNAWFYQTRRPNYVLGYLDDKVTPKQHATATVLTWERVLEVTSYLETVWRDELNMILAATHRP